MADRLGHKQTAAMFTLMVLDREVSNPELETIVGFTLTGNERTELNDLGYVVSTKPGRAFCHQLTESGWGWCEAELGVKTPPPHSRSNLIGGLYVLLGGFDDYLRRQNLRLADLFARTVEPTKADIESRIRTAYRKLARSPRDWVGLVDLRPMLGGASADAVDALLKELSRAGKVHLVPESNRKVLTAADHKAAIRIGGEDNHLLSIEAP
ncbi:hypothetical protein [Amycolatopsis sp. CA-230715]|uniref:hypothetical protein n=1 Tax=Amycolatopsis sp. CA-230715 TaxID=2745196 RepID=UPI001C030F7D|nr:hypothetical protein [Amycolatopsis sp. CA-230715]QWF83017.1 hypothetical protein HUW46_06456 [Amycolatopsis sp. CA-230715]